MSEQTELVGLGGSREQTLENALATILGLYDEDTLIINPEVSIDDQTAARYILDTAVDVLDVAYDAEVRDDAE